MLFSCRSPLELDSEGTFFVLLLWWRRRKEEEEKIVPLRTARVFLDDQEKMHAREERKRAQVLRAIDRMDEAGGKRLTEGEKRERERKELSVIRQRNAQLDETVHKATEPIIALDMLHAVPSASRLVGLPGQIAAKSITATSSQREGIFFSNRHVSRVQFVWKSGKDTETETH